MLTEQIKRLQAERLNLWEQNKALLDASMTEKRDFSAEENTQWETRDNRMNEIDGRITQLVEAQQREVDSATAFRALLDTPQIETHHTETRADSKEVELRNWFKGEGPRAVEYKPEAPTDFRALSKLSSTAGLNTVKTSFYDRLIAHLIEVSGILTAGPTVLNTSTGETIQVPITTAHSSGALVAEAATIPTSEPTFGQRSLGAYKYGALMQVSTELLNDTSVDLMGYLSMQAGRAVGNALGVHLVTGTGSSQPTGVVTSATLGVTGSTGVVGVPTADNLIDLYFSVIAPYRNSPQAAWMMKDSTLATVRKFKDTTNQYIWQPSYQVGTPDTILGKPVYTDPNVAAPALSAKSILFGDFSQYFVRMVDGIRFERSDDYAFNTDLVTFRCLIRADGLLMDQTGAVKYYAGAGT